MTYRRNPKTSGQSAGPKRDIYQEVTDTMIDMLAAGTVPWHQPWSSSVGMPLSMSSRHPYRGVNILLLGSQALAKGYVSPFWGTWNKIAELDGVDLNDPKAKRGWTGLRGQKATMVVFWKRIAVDDKDNPGKKKIIPFLKFFHVFNADQVTWTNPKGAPKFLAPATVRTPVEKIEAAEKIVAAYPSPPNRKTGTAAFYQKVNDTVTMPPINDFESSEEYYSTLFHELAHSTGVDWRLDRPGFSDEEFGTFGSAPYSTEELTAELTSVMLSAIVGIAPKVADNSAAYLAYWLRQLRSDPKLIVKLAARAQRAADYIQDVHFAEDAEATTDAGGGE